MFEGPLVSVVIPAHNAASTLRRALDSISLQKYQPMEVIVVDDGSTDCTAEIANTYVDRGLKLLRLANCGGAAQARNHGIKASSGDYVAFLDADDEWTPGKIEKQMALLLATPAMTFVSCGSNLIAPDGADCGNLYPGRQPAWGRDAWRTLLAYNFIATPSVIARHSALEAAGYFDPKLKVGEDQDMWIKLSIAGELGYVDEVLVRVHDTPNSLSSGAFKDQLTYTFPMIRRHLEAKRGELTQREASAILGTRLGRLGRSALGRGLQRDGVRLILRAIVLGNRPLDNTLFLLRATFPTRWLKRLLRQGKV